MPRRFRPSLRRTVRQSTATRRKTSRRRRVRVARSRKRFYRIYRNPLSGIKQLAVLNYVTDITLNPTPELLAGGGAIPSNGNIWQFRANSLYDPDMTGIGHQPMFFDNWMSVYWRYRVNYAQITVTVINHAVNTQSSTGVAIPNYSYKLFILRDCTGSTTEYPSAMNEMIEEGGKDIRWRFVAPQLNGFLPKLFHSVSPHQIANRAFKDDQLAGTVTANPEQPCYFYVGITSADGVTDPPSVSLNVRIKFFCEFFDRKAAQPQN